MEDSASGLTAPRLSALSVLVFAGPQTVGALAAAEQVRVPTVTRLVQGLEADGLVSYAQDAKDRRKVIVRATARGEKLLRAGQARRVGTLAARLAELDEGDMECLDRAATLIEALVRAHD
jgi:DNA-binding MarR family transcriptional regulator